MQLLLVYQISQLFTIFRRYNFISQSNLVMNYKGQSSFQNITQNFNPRYRKADFKQVQLTKRNFSSPADTGKPKPGLSQDILFAFQQISSNINNLQQFFRARMNVHEQQILQIAHLQIKKMQIQSQKVINRYSELIRQKNINNQILDLKYEVKFYQQRACEYFEQNNYLKGQIKKLKQDILKRKIGEECDHIALKNVSRKYLKQKSIRKKLQFNIKSVDSDRIQQSNRRLLFYTSNPEKHQISEINAKNNTSVGSDITKSKVKKTNFSVNLQKIMLKKRMQTEPTQSNIDLIE